MKVEASVDVGTNLNSLLERLAQQIGTTADKVFPWYVEQAYLQGVTTLWAIGLALVIGAVVILLTHRKADFGNGNSAAVLCGCAMPVLALALLAAFVLGPQQVRKIINPQFYAMTMLAEDIGKMRGR